MQHSNKPFPPYGTILHQFHLAKIALKKPIYITCGRNTWSQSKHLLCNGDLALCLPFKDKPTDYTWMVKGLNTIVIDTGGDHTLTYLILIATELLKSGAKMVWLDSHLCPNGQYFTQF